MVHVQTFKVGVTWVIYFALVSTCGNSTACCLVTKPGSLLLPPPLFSKPVPSLVPRPFFTRYTRSREKEGLVSTVCACVIYGQ